MISLPVTIAEKTYAALNGDSNAFGSLFQWYNPRLYAHALRICGNSPLAQDAVQETFISAFTHQSSLREPSSFYPWLKRILYNHCFRMLQKEKPGRMLDESIEKKDIVIERSIDESFEKVANRQWLYSALEKLSDELRSCVMIRYFSNFKDYESIASILGIPVGTVRSRLAAARDKLIGFYKNYEDSADMALQHSKKWSNYYFMLWDNLYGDSQVRNEMINHLHPLLNIRYTSGKPDKGRDVVNNFISEDIRHGSSLYPEEINSSGDITVLEGLNINSPEFPDHCPPSTVLVFQRRQDQIVTCHIFDSCRYN